MACTSTYKLSPPSASFPRRAHPYPCGVKARPTVISRTVLDNAKRQQVSKIKVIRNSLCSIALLRRRLLHASQLQQFLSRYRCVSHYKYGALGIHLQGREKIAAVPSLWTHVAQVPIGQQGPAGARFCYGYKVLRSLAGYLL